MNTLNNFLQQNQTGFLHKNMEYRVCWYLFWTIITKDFPRVFRLKRKVSFPWKKSDKSNTKF